MKEEKDASLYVQFITKVTQHVGSLDTAVREMSAQEVLQTIKDRNCKYITGVDNDESNDDDVMGPVDIIRTFDRTELKKDVQGTISKCFSNMMEAHALIQDAFIEASELVYVLPKRGMALLLEATATGSMVVQDTKVHDPVSRNCAVSMLYTYIILLHNLNSTELHLQGVAPRSQYSDHMPEAVMLQ